MSTSQPATAVNRTGHANIQSGGALDDAIPTFDSVTEARSVLYVDPAAESFTAIVAQDNIADGALVIAAQPDFPRVLKMRVTDANSSITSGTVTFVGVGARGQALNEVIDIADGGTHTYFTEDAYSTVTSITVAGLVGTTVGTDKIEVGLSAKFGLPAPATPTPSNFAVHLITVAGVPDAVAAVDTTAGWAQPTTAPAGNLKFVFWYTFEYTPVSDPHSHTVAAMTFTDSHTHVQDAHTHVIS